MRTNLIKLLFSFLQREFSDDCIFNETMQENYNIYSSSYHSTAQKTFYLALNKLGQPRKTHLPASKELGKLATYAKSLTFTVPEKRSEALIGRVFGINHIKHALKKLCDSGKSLIELTAKVMKQKQKCGKKQQKQKIMSSPVEKHRKSNIRCSEDNSCKKKKNKNGSGRGGGAVTSGGPPTFKQKNKKMQKKRRKESFGSTTPKSIPTTSSDRTSSTANPNADDPFDSTDHIVSSTEPRNEEDDDWEDATIPTTGEMATLVDSYEMDGYDA